MGSKAEAGIVFLDRDGTLNIDFGYVVSPDRIEAIPGAAKAVGDLKRGGYLVIVVSNQSAVGRGMAAAADVDACNAELARQLNAEDPDAVIDLCVYSPDAPENAGDTRKPGIGLLREVQQHWEVPIDCSWMVGDKLSDIRFGLNAGFRHDHCVLVKTGEGERSLAKWEGEEELTAVADIAAAAEYILERRTKSDS